MPGSAQEIRYINRDENTHLWLFRSIIKELKEEIPEVFTKELKEELREMVRTGINKNLIERYIKYIGNLRVKAIGLEPLFEGYNENPAPWVDYYADANQVKTDFFEAKSTAYAKAGALIDDL